MGSTEACNHTMLPLTSPLFSWGAGHQACGCLASQVTTKDQCHHIGGEPEVQPSGIYGDEPSAMEELYVSTHHMPFNIQID